MATIFNILQQEAFIEYLESQVYPPYANPCKHEQKGGFGLLCVRLQRFYPPSPPARVYARKSVPKLILSAKTLF